MSGHRGRIAASSTITDPGLVLLASHVAKLITPTEIVGQVEYEDCTTLLVRTRAGIYMRYIAGAMYGLPQNKVIAALTAEAASSGPDFGAEVRAWREARGLSQAQAAEALVVPVKTLQGWEQGKPCGLAGPIRKLMSLL